MAEKRVSVRLAAVGGKQVRAELEGVGTAGRGGSVDLNRFRAFFKWSSALDYAATGTGNSWLK